MASPYITNKTTNKTIWSRSGLPFVLAIIVTLHGPLLATIGGCLLILPYIVPAGGYEKEVSYDMGTIIGYSIVYVMILSGIALTCWGLFYWVKFFFPNRLPKGESAVNERLIHGDAIECPNCNRISKQICSSGCCIHCNMNIPLE